MGIGTIIYSRKMKIDRREEMNDKYIYLTEYTFNQLTYRNEIERITVIDQIAE